MKPEEQISYQIWVSAEHQIRVTFEGIFPFSLYEKYMKTFFVQSDTKNGNI